MNDHAKPVALQMWTVREAAQQDFVGTLEKIARLGYTGVEHVHLLGYGGLSPAQVRVRMDALGLQAVGMHLTLDEWESAPDAMIAVCQELNTPYGVVSWVGPERRKDEAAYRQMALSLQRLALRCENNGLRLLYHHHDYEFVRFNGEYALDLLWQAVGAQHLGIEVDVHWVRRAGEDPAAYLRKLGTTCPLVHLKDLTSSAFAMTNHRDQQAFTALGTGCLDFPAIAEAARDAHWFIVEQDYCQGDPFETVRISLENLRKLRLVA
jgi:sugar phosphate isomerase/epimerase